MAEPISPDLMPSLGRLVRGLSALFWGLPLALVCCVRAMSKTRFDLYTLDFLGPLLMTGLLLFGLSQMGHFQRQERVWMQALDRARIFALVNLGLAPFIYWHLKLPEIPAYEMAVVFLALSALLFLFTLNQVLQRLAAMLPDEALRQETRLFTTINQYLLVYFPLLAAVLLVLGRVSEVSLLGLASWLAIFSQWTVLGLMLLGILPVAVTMALIWKIKEVVLAGVFGAENNRTPH